MSMSKCLKFAGLQVKDAHTGLDSNMMVWGDRCAESSRSDISPGFLIIHVLGGTAPLKTAA